MIVQCPTFSKSLNPRNINKSVSDIRFRIRFQFECSFWISRSGCKLTILSDIQPANRIVIISAAVSTCGWFREVQSGDSKLINCNDVAFRQMMQNLVIHLGCPKAEKRIPPFRSHPRTSLRQRQPGNLRRHKPIAAIRTGSSSVINTAEKTSYTFLLLM